MQLGITLAQGIENLGLKIDAPVQQDLLQYLELLRKWNKVYNLTAIRDTEQMMSHHLLDSLSIVPYVRGPRVLDMGCGAGLPGIPLALARPDLQVVMMDANAKKTRFVQQAITELNLDNAEAVHARAEDYTAPGGFDTVTSRAFSSLEDFLGLAAPYLQKGGQLLAMKGRYPTQELELSFNQFRLIAVHQLEVPFLDSERHLVEMERTDTV
ncbi:MAG: 16S rRNA (guanine(527)-N(7))-methyltransferase RsmG [Gammaproteobacteria bacterium]|nr:16S rRNA (guanine(527)-N(7))-methyltransferase RsmG [Gammaproteobacteria bacterium]